MSVGLLEDSTKVNELADDRESCFYVLTWMALKFTKHTIKKGSLKTLLNPFNELDEDGGIISGGNLKRDSLREMKIEKSVEFNDRPYLDKLIAELTKIFVARYDHLPGSDMEPTLSEALIRHRKERMEALNRRGWLVETFRHHLDPDFWPTSDIAVKQSTGDERKRRRTR